MYQQRLRQLKDRRLYLNLTLEELAFNIGVGDRMVERWENYKSIPSMANFEAWCNALDLNIILSADTTAVEDWEPNQTFINQIKQEFIGVDYEYEVNNFSDWYKSKGERSADWNALFRMWVRRSQRFNGKTTSNDENNTKVLSSIAERMHASKNI